MTPKAQLLIDVWFASQISIIWFFSFPDILMTRLYSPSSSPALTGEWGIALNQAFDVLSDGHVVAVSDFDDVILEFGRHAHRDSGPLAGSGFWWSSVLSHECCSSLPPIEKLPA